MENNVTQIKTEGSEEQPGVTLDGTPGGNIAKGNAEAEANALNGGEEPETHTPLITDDAEFLDKIRKGAEEIDSITLKREELTANIALVFARFDNLGLNKKAVKAAMTYTQLSPEQKETYDLTYQLTRKALGAPVQDDLFEAYARKQVKAHQDKDKH